MKHCLRCDEEIKGRRAGAKYCSKKCQQAVSQKRYRVKKSEVKDQTKMWVMEDIEKLRKISRPAYTETLKLTANYGHSAGDMALMAMWALIESVKPEILEGL